MGLIKINIGRSFTVTAPTTSASDLAVTIGDRTYTETFDSDDATTVGNFVASHGKELNQELEIYCVAGSGASSGDITLYGVPDGRKFSTSNTYTEDSSRAATYSYDELSVGVPTTAGVLTVTTYIGSASANSLAITYFDESTAVKDAAAIAHSVSLNKNRVGSVKVSRASNTVVS